MNIKRWVAVLLAAFFAAALFSESALAQWHRGPRVGIGIHFGVPFYAPYYVPPPYYYYPPMPYYVPVPVAPSAPEYIEQTPPPVAPAPAPQASSPARSNAYWYYCAESKSYYPYVKECPGGWQPVTPQPPPG